MDQEHGHETITIFINNTGYQTSRGEMTGSDIKALAKVPGKTTSCSKLGETRRCPLATSRWSSFTTRCTSVLSPLERSGHSVSVPVRLRSELDSLDSRYEREVVEENEFVDVVLKDFELGEGFTVAKTELLIRVPKTYPDARSRHVLDKTRRDARQRAGATGRREYRELSRSPVASLFLASEVLEPDCGQPDSDDRIRSEAASREEMK